MKQKIFLPLLLALALLFVGCGSSQTEKIVCSDPTLAIIDQDTGILWQKGRSKLMNWTEATKYCSNLELCGISDWRLPSKNEYEEMLGNCNTRAVYATDQSECNACNAPYKNGNGIESKKCSSMFPDDKYDKDTDKTYYWTLDLCEKKAGCQYYDQCRVMAESKEAALECDERIAVWAAILPEGKINYRNSNNTNWARCVR